jgi:hypothetical protein
VMRTVMVIVLFGLVSTSVAWGILFERCRDAMPAPKPARNPARRR